MGVWCLPLVLVGCAAAPEPRDVPAMLRLQPSFVDEFDGSTLAGHWRTDFRDKEPPPATIARRTLYGNRERQVYVAPDYLKLGIQPHRIANGVLTIAAQPLSPEARGAMMAELSLLPAKQQRSAMRDVRYSSGMISTRGSIAQRHGFFEMRARWSGGKGVWPAFWLLPSSGAWPPEIDIMEAHGDKPDVVFQTKHSKLEPKAGERVPVPGGTGQWHRYGVLWTPRTLRFYVDGHETSRQTPPPDATGPMYMIANLAIGGYWPGDPDAETPFPATMEIDWIRAWSLPRDWQESRAQALDE
jgi:beta-glucanase (GH16 family)